jgi:outer membrane protein assembly factor BamB
VPDLFCQPPVDRDRRDDAAELRPEDQAIPGDYHPPGAVVRDGVLYHFEHERVRAVDLDTFDLLWTEEVDPDQAKQVRGLQPVGDRLLMLARHNRTTDGLVYILDPGSDGLEWEALDFAVDIAWNGELPVNDTHLLVPEETEAQVHHYIEAATGKVEWSAELPGRLDPTALTNDTAFTMERADEDDEPDLIRRVDLTDGRVVDEIPAPGEFSPAQRPTLVAGPDGDILMGTRGALDTATGELLWTHPQGRLGEEASLDGAGRFDEADPALLHVQDAGDAWVLEARTGELVEEDTPDPRPEAFENQNLWNSDAFDLSGTKLYLAPIRAFGPGMEDRLIIEFGAGTRHLTNYRTEDGAYVGVYQACAPDGMRSAGWDNATVYRACVAPRLFAVDYGVTGSEPQ